MCMVLPRLRNRVMRIRLASPMVVYKVLAVEKYSGRVFSPYQRYPYRIGIVATAKIEKRTGMFPLHEKQHKIIESGIHSFKSLEDAYDACQMTNNRFRDRNHALYESASVFECHIPRFSIYYTGYWDWLFPRSEIENIVSSKLIVVKNLDKEIA